MPKATITTKDGAKVVIEGSTEEVQELLGRLHAPTAHTRKAHASRRPLRMAADPGHFATFIVLTPLPRMTQCVGLAVFPHYSSLARPIE